MRGHVYLGLFVALTTWHPTTGQFFYNMFGGGGGGGGAGGAGAGGGHRGGGMGFGFPFFMSCSPNFGGRQRPSPHAPMPGTPPAGGAGMQPNARGATAGMGGMAPQGQSQNRGFGMQAMMFGAMDAPDVPDIPAFPMPGPGGSVTWAGCFCDEIGGFGFGSGECMSFLTGNWQNDRCARWGMCCTCNDMGMWKR